MSFGPHPWQQAHWDARAAANFMAGGAGAGVVVMVAAGGAPEGLRAPLMGLALALVALGLACVWAEIGRPWRAAHVFFNPRTSWMTREALLAPLLLASGALALWRVPGATAASAALALGFLYCQARILQAAKGIPAWREPLTVPLLVATGLAEGAGLVWMLAPLATAPAWAAPPPVLWSAFGVLLLVRFALGARWYRRLAPSLRPAARRAVNRAGHAFNAGSLLPLALVLGVLAAPLTPGWSCVLQVLAGVGAVLGGTVFKYLLVTQAAFNQGFALPHLPVRGARR